MDGNNFLKMRKDVLKVSSLFEKSDEKEYWLSKSPNERLEAVEIMRRILYGYNPSTTRLQRVIEVAERK